MLIDCETCEVRALACGDCVVTVLLGAPPEGVVLDEEERRALDVLADSGMVPPLRLVDNGPAGTPARGTPAPASPAPRHAGQRRIVS